MSDLISRQDAIESVMNHYRVGDKLQNEEMDWCAEMLNGLPSAEKKGKWIDYCGGVKCDQCGFECDDTYYLDEANFCPNCGARMEESDG